VLKFTSTCFNGAVHIIDDDPKKNIDEKEGK